jgi:TetR/AcrR family transcriptional regulator, transcriptional repressor for nem operon
VPKTTRGERTRSGIVQAAAALMRGRGIRGTTIDDVLLASGSKKGQLYHHFSGKEELVRAVISYQLEQVLVEQGPYLEELGTLAGFRQWFAALVQTFDAPPGRIPACALGSLATELGGERNATQAALDAAFYRWRAPIVDGLRQVLPAAAQDAEALADFVLASLQGGILLARTRGEVGPLAAALDHAYAHVAQLAQTETKESQ